MTDPNSDEPQPKDEKVIERLQSIAELGTVDIEWPELQQAIKSRLLEVIASYNAVTFSNDCKDEDFNLEHSQDEILELISSFTEPPFTIQRVCELLISPSKYYDKVSTFLRGLEKNLRVISSNDWPT